MKRFIAINIVMLAVSAFAFASAGNKTTTVTKQDLLIKVTPELAQTFSTQILGAAGMNGSASANMEVKSLDHHQAWFQVTSSKKVDVNKIRSYPGVLYVQPNYKIKLLENYKAKDAATIAKVQHLQKLGLLGNAPSKPDNLPIPDAPSQPSGADPLVGSQWGMIDIGSPQVNKRKGGEGVIVAVIDTGIDYTHPDLLPNLWRNTKEIPNNGIDDDKNGYIDDVIGWDFAAKDNKPYDLASTPMELLTGGGNPGHGTHCAGNVAARGDNAQGIAGVAPKAKIMGLRFITEKGEGTTADAISAIRYAVDNGAKVLSNSWGSEGEEAGDPENIALRDSIKYAMSKDVIFIAAAGNGHNGVGYDNDTDSRPGYPASYDIDNIMSVAAVDVNGNLGSFSNWGLKTVHIGAPGVKVFSTTVDGKYSDMVIDMYGIKASWDGTSMACPHVAGAAALYLSEHPGATYKQIKDAIIQSARKIPALQNKSVSGGKLDVATLIK